MILAFEFLSRGVCAVVYINVYLVEAILGPGAACSTQVAWSPVRPQLAVRQTWFDEVSMGQVERTSLRRHVAWVDVGGGCSCPRGNRIPHVSGLTRLKVPRAHRAATLMSLRSVRQPESGLHIRRRLS